MAEEMVIQDRIVDNGSSSRSWGSSVPTMLILSGQLEYIAAHLHRLWSYKRRLDVPQQAKCICCSLIASSAFVLQTAFEQVSEEAKEINTAKATVDELKEDGIGDSALVLMELFRPLKSALQWFQEVIKWERPVITTITMIGISHFATGSLQCFRPDNGG
ncbi:hypothetical protein L6452_14830 [Arctium lappa]|uniref:Uncharacterized protein n=1 Tax=Arctium lappa TaxID=4217 RepID=A0ACB9CMB1_ARCLA|nr:hypothetical protein L6452_14830 [Arctium lappa]